MDYPGGLCTRNCVNDVGCGTGGWCVDIGLETRVCLPDCTNDDQVAQCAHIGSACVLFPGSTNSGRVCAPSCWADGIPNRPVMEPMCVQGMCNEYVGACTAQGFDPTLADNGAPCVSDDACRSGRCITEVDEGTGEPTGWLGGACISFARLGPIEQGAPLPQSNCPNGSVTIPFDGTRAGDIAFCLQGCADATMCRPGYGCERLDLTMPAGAMTSTGVCLPLDCAAQGAMCPTGYTCQTMGTGTGTSGRCVANAAPDACVPDAESADATAADGGN